MSDFGGFEAAYLCAAAFTAGAMNAVAGGGTFWLFPSLVAAGLDARSANATNTFILWIGSMSSALAFRQRAPNRPGLWFLVGSLSVLGAGLGAALLVKTSLPSFRGMVPWLMLAACVIFILGPTLARWANRSHGPSMSLFDVLLLVVFQSLIALYGGFFGAGIGVLMLALFGLVGITNFHEANSLKTAMASIINGVAAITLCFQGMVVWPHGWLLGIAAGLGAWCAAKLALKIPPQRVRGFALVVAIGITICFFLPTDWQPTALRPK